VCERVCVTERGPDARVHTHTRSLSLLLSLSLSFSLFLSLCYFFPSLLPCFLFSLSLFFSSFLSLILHTHFPSLSYLSVTSLSLSLMRTTHTGMKQSAHWGPRSSFGGIHRNMTEQVCCSACCSACCSMVQNRGVLQCPFWLISVLEFLTACCSVSQHVAACCSIPVCLQILFQLAF